jgi:hypothetical protein
MDELKAEREAEREQLSKQRKERETRLKRSVVEGVRKFV